MMELEALLPRLRCPRSGAPLACDNGRLRPAGQPWAYPVADGIPVLLWPEALQDDGPAAATTGRYAGAYGDMAHYSAGATVSAAAVAHAVRDHGLDRPPADGEAFPEPPDRWLAREEGLFDLPAELEAYRHLAPLTGKHAAQVGGKGVHAVKFLRAGAATAVLVTPVLQEARFALALADACGVADRFAAVVGIAEELPLADGTVDALYSPGSLHHTDVGLALPELWRVLAAGGRFACVDPWRAPGYRLGTRLFGKREPEVGCRPLTAARLEPAFQAIPDLRLVHHGAFTRYPLIALAKLGLRVPRNAVLALTRADDAIAGRIPGARKLGSGVAVLAEKPAWRS
jgi:SAM-dependent methyltransferase/uncharacterized protein YbaR (Trm112 family)